MEEKEEKKIVTPATPAGGENTVVTGKTGNQGDEANQQAAADAERMAEAGRAARIPNYEVGGEKTTQLESSADKTFQENMEQQKYAHTFDFIDKLEKEREELSDKRTPDQKKKDARREKMAKIFAALGDGVAAMSNLVLASKGAIPYQSKSSLSKAVGDRYDKFRKDLEERKTKSLALSERIAQLRQGVQKMQDEDERLRYARKKKEEDDKYNRERQEKLDNATIAHKNAMAGYYGEKAETDRRRLAVYEAMAKINAEAKLINANANMKRANKYQPGGSRSGKTWTFDSKTYNNFEEYKKAVEAARQELNIEPTYKTEYRSGFDNKETVRTKSTARVAAEVERARGGGKWVFSIHKK